MKFSFTNTWSLLPNSIQNLTLFSSKEELESISRQQFFNKYHYYSHLLSQSQPKREILNYYENFYLALYTLMQDELGCIFETENEINVFVPIDVCFTSAKDYLNRDFFETSIVSSFVLYPKFDHIVEKYSSKQNIKVHFVLPLLGAVSTFNLSETSLDQIQQQITKFSENLTFSGNSSADLERYFKYSKFFLYSSIFENNCRTPLLGRYNIYGNAPLKFLNIEENILFHFAEFEGLSNFSVIMEQMILIVQPYAHGEWYIFHNSDKFYKDVSNKILGVVRSYFSRKTFTKFLTEIYDTIEVIPFNLFEDVYTISTEDILKEISEMEKHDV